MDWKVTPSKRTAYSDTVRTARVKPRGHATALAVPPRYGSVMRAVQTELVQLDLNGLHPTN